MDRGELESNLAIAKTRVKDLRHDLRNAEHVVMCLEGLLAMDSDTCDTPLEKDVDKV